MQLHDGWAGSVNRVNKDKENQLSMVYQSEKFLSVYKVQKTEMLSFPKSN
jgi:hypothetical protein